MDELKELTEHGTTTKNDDLFRSSRELSSAVISRTAYLCRVIYISRSFGYAGYAFDERP